MAGEMDKEKGRTREVTERAVGDHRRERKGKRNRAGDALKSNVERVRQRLERDVDDDGDGQAR
jgi:uncharacterized protein YjbJ (UPF0337 family)